MHKTALITGGGTGLGRAIAQQLASRNLRVIIIGRRGHKLKETQAFFPQLITAIPADISSPKDRLCIVNKLKHTRIDYLVHNAAIALPIVPLEKITLKNFRAIMRTNVEAPLFLTQLLLPYLNKNARILHISSDCAQYPLSHWIPYCTSKAALLMIYRCLQKEFHAKNIHIGSIDPGMMDTPMQQAILDDTVAFPEKMSLAELKAQGLLFSANFSARKCVKLLLNVSVKKFQAGEHHVS